MAHVLRPGEKLHGYRLLSPLSPGPPRTYLVWKAVKRRQPPVVIKFCLRSKGRPSLAAHLLANEAHWLATFSHAGIPRHIETFSTRHYDAIVMTEMPGYSLDRWRYFRADYSSPQWSDPVYIIHVAMIMKKLCAILAHVHSHGCVHGDIKPGNVTLDQHGAVSLVDFGICHRIGHEHPALPESPTSIVGTPSYLPPELFAGEECTPQTDLYMFGLLAFRLFTGVTPLLLGTTIETGFLRLHQDPPPIWDYAPAVPRALGEIVMSCIERYPANRPASALHISASLARLHT